MSEEFYTFFFLFKMVGYKNYFQNHNEKSTMHNGKNIILLAYLTNIGYNGLSLSPTFKREYVHDK
jgi:hypothetical protein